MKFLFLLSLFLLNAVHGLTEPKEAAGETGLADTCNCNIEKLYQSIVRRSCIGGMVWNNTCVYLPYTTGSNVKYDQAVRICVSSGGWLLKITDDKMYDVVYDYLNRTWVGNMYPYPSFWLGMTFQPVNNPDHLITITPEWKIALNRWYAPVTGSKYHTWVKMNMKISLRGESIYKGIYNSKPTDSYTPLCQYQLYA